MISTKKVVAKAKELGMTKSELASALNISVTTVDAWDKGVKDVYPSLGRQLADIFGCDLSEIQEDTPADTADPVMPAPVEDHSVITEDDPADENVSEDVSEDAAEDEVTEEVAEKPAEEVPAIPDPAPVTEKKERKARKPRTASAVKGEEVSDLLLEKMKATKYNVREIKKNDLNATVKWLSDYAKSLEDELKTGISLLSGSVRELNRIRLVNKSAAKPEEPKYSKTALEVAAKFDKMSDASKNALLTILGSLK